RRARTSWVRGYPGLRPTTDRDPLGRTVVRLRFAVGVERVDRLELRVVPIPVGVEPHPPATGTRDADVLTGIRLRREVGQDDDVVPRTTLQPAVPAEHAAARVDVMDRDVRAAQAAGHVEGVPAE